MDCGPTCLRMVAKHYGKKVSMEYLRDKAEYGKEGVTMLGLAEAAESMGFKTVGAKISFEQLVTDAPLPAILHWQNYHFVILTPGSTAKKLVIADPAKGLIKISKEEFLKSWLSTVEGDSEKGLLLLLEPTEQFYKRDNDKLTAGGSKLGWGFLFSYLKKDKRYIFQLLLGLLLGSIFQLIFPYLTQSIVDTGINTRNLNFIQIVLAAQLMLLFSQTVVEFIRSRILLHISTRINISLLSDFWAKLLRLPVRFFDTRHPGDILQRVGDHHRIESFLTGTALSTTLSMLNLVIFSFVLLRYSPAIFLIFIVGSILYLLWIQLFLRYRRQLDYKRFALSARENNATMQMVYGVQELKLNNAETSFRWAWEGLQAGLFKLNFKSLSLNQYQQVGSFFINQGKNIIITFFVAKLVVDGSLTLGTMLAIQYIIGQLNSPIEQLIGFFQQAQDAKISLERLNDIHKEEDEELADKEYVSHLPADSDIIFKNVSFTYPGVGNEAVLTNINLTIPAGKVTALVGMSGSGKTTLIKLLLRFYENYKGEIHFGNIRFDNISPKHWRSLCGSVMQDSYIFNDSISKNITVSAEQVNNEQLIKACQVANILPFIESLPNGFYTKLGAEGHGISGGQRQRIAIARAVYKNPRFMFMDEATNSLDANNEKVILENLQGFSKDKTVVVVAHRLSTVQQADKIIVMDAGQVAEEGTHQELTAAKGKYYALVKNQLELGN